MAKKVLSLALVLAICMGLAVPALAAGEKKTVTNEEWGLVITMEGFLREETHHYASAWGDETITETIYVVADNSKVTVEAMEGRKYATTPAEQDEWQNGFNEGGEPFVYYGSTTYAYYSPSYELVWDKEEDGLNVFAVGEYYPMEKAETFTVEPNSEQPKADASYGINIAAESDFEQFVPFEGEPIESKKPKAAKWAQEDLEKAYGAMLFPDAIDPFEEDCTREMTRAEFAAVTVSLYFVMQGVSAQVPKWLSTPFYDIGEHYDIEGSYMTVNGKYKEGDYAVVRVNGDGTKDVLYRTIPDHALSKEEQEALYTAAGVTEDMRRDVNYKKMIGYAYDLGFVNGTSETTFSPNDTLTREQAAVMLSRVYTKLRGSIPKVSATSFADDASVSKWAKSGVAFMADKGIVSGVGDNNFAPQQVLSIQEAMVMAQRMLEKL